jgi:hypothetical protein
MNPTPGTDFETNKTSGFYEGTGIAVDQFCGARDRDEVAPPLYYW